MTVFIGLRAMLLTEGGGGVWSKHCVKHFNVERIVMVDESKMQLTLDNGLVYRLDEESMQVFLSTIYGDLLRGDKMSEDV